jgi:hypothetical protein
MPFTSSITKDGPPLAVVPASRTRAMLAWSISASACRSASNRAMTCRCPCLDDLDRDLALDGARLLGEEDDSHAALADLLEQLVRPDQCPRTLRFLTRHHVTVSRNAIFRTFREMSSATPAGCF